MPEKKKSEVYKVTFEVVASSMEKVAERFENVIHDGRTLSFEITKKEEK